MDSQQARKVSKVLVQLRSGLTVWQIQSVRWTNNRTRELAWNSAQILQNDFSRSPVSGPFPLAGLYSTLNLEAKLIDPEGHRWRSGVKHSLNVKSFEDRTNSNKPSQILERQNIKNKDFFGLFHEISNIIQHEKWNRDILL